MPGKIDQASKTSGASHRPAPAVPSSSRRFTVQTVSKARRSEETAPSSSAAVYVAGTRNAALRAGFNSNGQKTNINWGKDRPGPQRSEASQGSAARAGRIPRQQKIQAAKALLANPPRSTDVIYAEVPKKAWHERGYQRTATVQWTNVPNLPDPVRAHVHYKWEFSHWARYAGHAWIVNVGGWRMPTPKAVVKMLPKDPPDKHFHP